MSRPAAILRREQIERAQQRARAELERLRDLETEWVAELTERMADEIAALVEQFAAPDGSLPPEALLLIEQLLAQRLAQADAEWRARLGAALAGGIGLGAGVAAEGEALRGVVQRSTDFLNAFRAADGLSLSDRLWRVSQQLQDDVLTTLRTGVASGMDARRQVEALLTAGKPVPSELAAAVRDGNASTVAARIRAALTGEGGSAEFVLNRLLRTEMNRAYTESFVESLRDVDGVAGVKFTLSPAHPRPDICDMYAAANLHGMGPGVYPLGAHPYPAHPQTLSYLQPVFVEEITDIDRAGQETEFDWLRRQSGALQDAALGGQRKGAAFRAGQLQPGELRWPWYAIAPRLGGNPP